MVKVQIYEGDVLRVLQNLPSASVHCCVTSPPYWGLRDYGVSGQLGLEKTPEEYIEKMVGVFREVRRVLRKDGTLWLNMGDSYAGSWGNSGHRPERTGIAGHQREKNTDWFERNGHPDMNKPVTVAPPGLKPKDLCGIPWRVALALQADGWWLRSDIIWQKPNPMPASVTDRPTTSHEYIFLLTKAAHYFYDQEAVRQKAALSSEKRGPVDFGGAKGRAYEPEPGDPNYRYGNHQAGRTFTPGPTANLRSVWTLATQPYPEAHFATFPASIPKRCIKAGTSEKGCCPKCGSSWARVVEKHLVPTAKAAKTFVIDDRDRSADSQDQGSNRQKDGHKPGWVRADETTGWTPTCTCDAGEPTPCTVLDPFSGAGTTAMVAAKLGRDAIGIELNPEYVTMSTKRLKAELGMLAKIRPQKVT